MSLRAAVERGRSLRYIRGFVRRCPVGGRLGAIYFFRLSQALGSTRSGLKQVGLFRLLAAGGDFARFFTTRSIAFHKISREVILCRRNGRMSVRDSLFGPCHTDVLGEFNCLPGSGSFYIGNFLFGSSLCTGHCT